MGGTHYLPASWGKSTNLNQWMSQLMIKPFSSVLLSGTHMVSTATVAGVVLIACPIPALAQNATSNITQVSISIDPISITGTRLGGSVSATGSGLTAGAPPTVAADGSLAAGTGMTANAGTTFNFNVTARSGDGALAAANALGTNLTPTTSQYGSQSGEFSGAGTGSALAITDANVATVDAGSTQGVTATALVSTTMRNGSNTAEVRRVGTSTNQQATFTTERQGAQFQFGGSGLTAVTGTGGLSTGGVTALGAAPTVTAATGGATQAGVDFTLNQSVRTGQAAAAVTATSTDVTQPAYGSFTNTLGGTTARDLVIGATTGTVGSNAINNLTVGTTVGGAGTSSSLSVIQSLTAF